ncbi:Rieske 2Fe-2S domain-containing protein [Marinomonas sp. M1K-6]|uniref:Rieske 2Fe-2S domain-containing protein n=1 Tax=Marinomonas profundi TaxID=2726122 RepID=A0A847QYS5_9GAMM|nr:Rieske 2Fe-2S domain-containing protein [Marinomonas profundi]NLQ18279.1 Rieske 2Fe-2S domain-containing protein [Marinomonas profundi]UDV02342.1 Rieske 2Fe-2S domain-containing protein [Marinomonas profundi]
MSDFDEKALCHIDDIDEGATKGFLENAAGHDLFFVVKKDGQLFAWRNACPHVNGAPMAWRKDAYMDAKKQHVACHAHGALFEPTTGLCIQGPCLGKALEKIPIHISQAGVVSIQVTNVN